MPRPGVNYLDIAQAATKLVQQNTRPSIEEIRKVLGTGSNSTINRHLRAWREKQGYQLEAQQGLPDTLLIAVKGIYEAIKEEAEQRINATKTQAHQAVDHLQAQLAEITHLHHQLTQERHSLENMFNQTQEEKLALQRRVDELARQLDKKSDENSLLQERITDKKSEIDQIIQQLKHAQDNLDHYREFTRKEREKDTLRFENSMNRLENETLQHREIVTQLKGELSAVLGQTQLLERDKTIHMEKMEQMQFQCNEYIKELQSRDSNLSVLNKKYDVLVKENQLLTEISKSDQDSLHALKLKLENTEGKLEILTTALKKAEDNMANFSQKNMFLVQEKTELTAQLRQLQATIC